MKNILIFVTLLTLIVLENTVHAQIENEGKAMKKPKVIFFDINETLLD